MPNDDMEIIDNTEEQNIMPPQKVVIPDFIKNINKQNISTPMEIEKPSMILNALDKFGKAIVPPKNALADLFEVPQENDNDIYTDDLLELPEDDNIQDLFNVSKEDIIGRPRTPKIKKQKFIRTSKPNNLLNMGGIQ
jgi:hypothetical protein